MGKVIINSDDFGYSHGVNYGIIEAYKRGILTSTTLMANMPGFKHAVLLKKRFSGLGVGVHLNITCGEPLLKNVQSLIKNGKFKSLSFYEQPFSINLNELYQEWDAQIQKVYKAGINPTHLDSHHHTHSFGENQSVVLELAKKYKLPVRGNFKKMSEIKHTEYFEELFDQIGNENINNPDDYFKEYLEELLNKLRIYSSTEIMCHTAYIDKYLLENSSFVYPRINQLEFLIHSNFSNIIRTDSSIELCTYENI